MHFQYRSKEWSTQKLNEMFRREIRQSKHSELSRSSLAYLVIFFFLLRLVEEKPKAQVETFSQISPPVSTLFTSCDLPHVLVDRRPSHSQPLPVPGAGCWADAPPLPDGHPALPEHFYLDSQPIPFLENTDCSKALPEIESKFAFL